MRLTLPLPPSANRLWRAFRGRTVLSAEGRKYKARVASLFKAYGCDTLDGEVAVYLDVYRARRSGDLDNRVKALLDALKGLAFHDDKQVVELHARRYDDKADPRVEVWVEPHAAPGLTPEATARAFAALERLRARTLPDSREVPDSSPSWAPKARVSSAYRRPKGGQP